MIASGALGMILSSIIIGYMFVCLYFGFLHAGRITNLKEFALGYKNISTAMLVATMYATHLGAGSTLGLIEQINNVGIIAIIATLGGVCRWYLTRFIFCKNVHKFSGCLSQAGVMEKLYGTTGSFISNVVNLVASVGIVSIQIVVMGFVMQCFFGLSSAAATLLGAMVIIMYSASGGVKAVILTDLVQLMLFGIVIIAIFALSMHKMTSQPDFWQSLPASKTWIMPYDTHSALLVAGMIIYAFIPVGGNAPFMQRILISGSDKQLYKTFSYAALIDLVAMFAITGIAIILLPITGEGTLNKEGLFAVIQGVMNPILVTGTVVGVMAVTMSTADSWLNSGAVMIAQLISDSKGKLSDINQVKVARGITVLLGAAAAQVALMGDSVLSLLLLTTCFMEPLILVPIAAGFLGYKFHEADYKRSVVFAILAVFCGAYLEGEFGFISLLFGLIGSTVGLTWRKQWNFLKAGGTPITRGPQYRKGSQTLSVREGL